MKKLIFITLAVLATLNFANAQTLNEVLDNHFKALGQEKLVAVKSYIMKAKVTQMGMEMPMEMRAKKPDMFIMTVDVEGQIMVQAFDGQKGWMIAPWVSSEPQELAGDQLAQAKDQANLDGELYNYEKNGATAELAGKVNIDGKELYRILFTPKGGTQKEYFIDAQSYLLVKMKAKLTAMGQTVDLEENFSDFKTIEGVTLPGKIEQSTPMGTGVILIEEIKFNENFEDSIFKQPAK